MFTKKLLINYLKLIPIILFVIVLLGFVSLSFYSILRSENCLSDLNTVNYDQFVSLAKSNKLEFYFNDSSYWASKSDKKTYYFITTDKNMFVVSFALDIMEDRKLWSFLKKVQFKEKTFFKSNCVAYENH